MITIKQEGFALATVLIYSLLSAMAIMSILQLHWHEKKQLASFVDFRVTKHQLELRLTKKEQALLTMTHALPEHVRLLDSLQCVDYQQQFWQVNYYQLQVSDITGYSLESVVAKPTTVQIECDEAFSHLQWPGRISWRVLYS